MSENESKTDEARAYLTGLLVALSQSRGSVSFAIDFGREGGSTEELDKEVEKALSDHLQLESGLREVMAIPADVVGVDDVLKYIEGRVMKIQGDRNEAAVLAEVCREFLGVDQSASTENLITEMRLRSRIAASARAGGKRS